MSNKKIDFGMAGWGVKDKKLLLNITDKGL